MGVGGGGDLRGREGADSDWLDGATGRVGVNGICASNAATCVWSTAGDFCGGRKWRGHGGGTWFLGCNVVTSMELVRECEVQGYTGNSREVGREGMCQCGNWVGNGFQ